MSEREIERERERERETAMSRCREVSADTEEICVLLVAISTKRPKSRKIVKKETDWVVYLGGHNKN